MLKQTKSIFGKSRKSKLRMVEKWKQHSALSSLAACHEFYCPNEIRMEKETRNVFVKTEKKDYDQFIKDDAERLLDYCANDVHATLSVFRSLYEWIQISKDLKFSWYSKESRFLVSFLSEFQIDFICILSKSLFILINIQTRSILPDH